MRKKLRKALKLMLTAMIVASFAACGTGEKNEIKEAKIWMSVGHSKHFWEKKIDEYNKIKSVKSGVKLVLETKTDEEYQIAMSIAVASNQLPELYFWGGCQKSVEAGVAYPISDLPGMDEMIEKYRPYMQEYVHNIGDDVYNLPFSMTTNGLVYNKDMFKAAGIVDENGEAKPPKTLDEVREYAKILTDPSKQQYGIIFPMKWTSWLGSDIGSMVIASSGKVRGYDPVDGTYDYSVYEPVMKMIQGIKKDGSCYPGAENFDNNPARAIFSLGKIGMKISYSFDAGVFNVQFPAVMDWGVAPLPVADVEKCYNQLTIVGSSVMVSKGGVEKIGKEAMADIFKFLYSDESIAQLYKQGFEIPCIWEIAEGIKINDELKGWAEFAEMVKISTIGKQEMPMETKSTDQDFRDKIINRVWQKEEDPSYILSETTKISNDNVKKYKDAHPEYNYSVYIDKEWKEKIKRSTFK